LNQIETFINEQVMAKEQNALTRQLNQGIEVANKQKQQARINIDPLL
jgi:hypothetical protein